MSGRASRLRQRLNGGSELLSPNSLRLQTLARRRREGNAYITGRSHGWLEGAELVLDILFTFGLKRDDLEAIRTAALEQLAQEQLEVTG